MAFDVLLETLCSASGMSISMNKFGFFFHEMDMWILQNIQCFLPFKADPIQLGFKYLGFFIKPLGYQAKDWHWLVEKFEKRIHLWSNKFLSLGGRLVLIRVVLTSLPVYWFALVPLPKSILNKLRKLIFSFL